jgi:hypothetical protein
VLPTEKLEFLRSQNHRGSLRHGFRVWSDETGPSRDGAGEGTDGAGKGRTLISRVRHERAFASRTREGHLDGKNIRAEEREVVTGWCFAIHPPRDRDGAGATGTFDDIPPKFPADGEGAATEWAEKVDRRLGLHVGTYCCFKA